LGEFLTLGLANWTLGGGESGMAQEVFGIGVRHRYFTFWHSELSNDYLKQVSKKPENLTAATVMKCWPISLFGLDICNPTDRQQIVFSLYTLNEYLVNGPKKVGEWKKQ
jgi:hypothetical protein